MGLHFNTSIACLAVSLVAMPQSAFAKEANQPIVVEPKGPWNLDFGENRCRLARLFGDGENETVFLIDQWNPARVAAWTVAGEAVKKFKDRETSYTFGSGGAAGDFKFIPSTFGDYGTAIMHVSTFVATGEETETDATETSGDQDDPRGLPAIDAEGAAEITTLTLSQKGRDPVQLNLGKMDAPLAALNVCTADLVENWGFDLDEQRTVVTPPKIENLAYVAGKVQREYPSDALRGGKQADFHLRMTIDVQGQIESCVWLSQTKADNFDHRRAPCSIFQRYAKITPAMDAEGNPVRTYLTNRVVYRMP